MVPKLYIDRKERFANVTSSFLERGNNEVLFKRSFDRLTKKILNGDTITCIQVNRRMD